MPQLQRLHPGHAPAVLDFELANRAYFAAFISDRGDEYFDQFTEQHSALLTEQEAGTAAYYVLVAEDGSVLGRFNLYRLADGTAELGYRVAQHAAGRGLATGTVRELCRVAADRHGLRTLRAATSHENTASQQVLIKAGFVPVGPADPAEIGGKQGTRYERDLTAGELQDRAAGGHFDGGDAAAEQHDQAVTMAGANHPGVLGQRRDDMLGDLVRVGRARFLVPDVQVVAADEPNAQHNFRHDHES